MKKISSGKGQLKEGKRVEKVEKEKKMKLKMGVILIGKRTLMRLI